MYANRHLKTIAFNVHTGASTVQGGYSDFTNSPGYPRRAIVLHAAFYTHYHADPY